MSKDIPSVRRNRHCLKGAQYQKYRVFINPDQAEQLENSNYFFYNNFIRTYYHEPIEGYQEFSYVSRKSSLQRSEFIDILSSMGISDYIIPDQHCHNKYWNL